MENHARENITPNVTPIDNNKNKMSTVTSVNSNIEKSLALKNSDLSQKLKKELP